MFCITSIGDKLQYNTVYLYTYGYPYMHNLKFVSNRQDITKTYLNEIEKN